MSPLNLLLWLGGVALIAVGYLRAREPWRRYTALRQQQTNVERYQAWRGGVRGRAGEQGTTGADVAMAMFRRRAQLGAGIALVGFVLVVAGFALR
jgi:hypothetical protein